MEQEILSSRSLPNNNTSVTSKSQIILQGDDSSVTHAVRGNEVTIVPSVASSISQASGRGATSMRVTSKPISKREWDLRNPTGHIIAVSSQGRYLAYVIRGPPPSQQRSNTSDESGFGDRIRVCNRRTASKGLLSGLLGSTLDLAFSYDKDAKPLLAAIDDYGCVLVVRVIENEQQTVLTFQPVVSVFPPGDPGSMPTTTWRRVVWSPYVRCIDTESVPDLAQSLIVTSDSRAELWRFDVISSLAGGRQSSTEPLLADSITSGRHEVTEHQLPITDAVLSCDGEHLIVGTTSLDGYVNFLQLDAVDEASDGYNVSVLQHWSPHDGRPVYSLCFLDNVEESLSTMWKYALTLSQPLPDANSGYPEIKLWHCQTWECLQTLSFQPSLQTLPSLRLQLSLTGDFAFLTDVNRAVLYLIHLDISETSAFCSSLTELLLASECLDFALLKVGFRSPKVNDYGSYMNGNDDQENVSSFFLNGNDSGSIGLLSSSRTGNVPVTGHLIAVSPKIIHELTIKLTGLPSKATDRASPNLKQRASARSEQNLAVSDIGRHLVTPDLLNRSLTSATKNSPGGASSLTGVTSIPLNTTAGGDQDDQSSSRPTTTSISLLPGGIAINSPHGSQKAAPTTGPSMVIHTASVDSGGMTDRSRKSDVVGMLFEAADRYRASQQTDSNDANGLTVVEPNRLHRPSPPPSDTSLEVADILNTGRPVGGLEGSADNDNSTDELMNSQPTNKSNADFSAMIGSMRPDSEQASVTPQLLAPGALTGSIPDSARSVAVGRTSQAATSRTPRAAAGAGATPTSAAAAAAAEQNRQIMSELASFKDNVSTMAEGHRTIVQLLSALTDRVNSLEMRHPSVTLDAQSFESSNMASQLGDIVGRQATARVEMLLTEAISDCRNQLDANGRQAVADVKTAVSQQVAERVHASMDVFRHALQGVVTSRPVVDAVASATAESASHAVATSSREVFSSTVLPSIDRSVQSMLTQLGDTLAQGTAQYEQHLRNNLDTTLTAHQQAIQQQYSNIESAIISRVETTLDQKFTEHMQTFEQRIAESNKALQAAVLRSISDRMETLAKQTASSVDQAVAGAVARSRPVTPAPTPVNTSSVSTAETKRQISELIRRSEWNAAFQTALSATDLPMLVWLCQQVPITTIFKSAGPCPLSQAVLLSFIQQMAFDLTTQSELKADWLSEAIMALDVSDSLVNLNLPTIARGADTGIERFLTAIACATPGSVSAGSARVGKQLRMAQSIIRSLLMSTGGSAAASGGKN